MLSLNLTFNNDTSNKQSIDSTLKLYNSLSDDDWNC
jgi:hypothetical protein